MWSRWVAGQYRRPQPRAALGSAVCVSSTYGGTAVAHASRDGTSTSGRLQSRQRRRTAPPPSGTTAATCRSWSRKWSLVTKTCGGSSRVAHAGGVSRVSSSRRSRRAHADERPAPEVRAVGDVVAEDAQPAREPAEHRSTANAGSASMVALTAILARTLAFPSPPAASSADAPRTGPSAPRGRDDQRREGRPEVRVASAPGASKSSRSGRVEPARPAAGRCWAARARRPAEAPPLERPRRRARRRQRRAALADGRRSAARRRAARSRARQAPEDPPARPRRAPSAARASAQRAASLARAAVAEEGDRAALADEGRRRLVEGARARARTASGGRARGGRSRPAAPAASAAVVDSSGSANQPSVLNATAGPHVDVEAVARSSRAASASRAPRGRRSRGTARRPTIGYHQRVRLEAIAVRGRHDVHRSPRRRPRRRSCSCRRRRSPSASARELPHRAGPARAARAARGRAPAAPAASAIGSRRQQDARLRPAEPRRGSRAAAAAADGQQHAGSEQRRTRQARALTASPPAAHAAARRSRRRTACGRAARRCRPGASSSRVRPLLAQLALVQHEDAVGVLDRREPVRDHERRAAREELLERVLDQPLGLRVDARGRLVEDEDGRVVRQRAREGEQLALPAREVAAALADLRVVAAQALG